VGDGSGLAPVHSQKTEVRPAPADGTVWETVWESRSLPAVIQGRDESLGPSFFRESDLGPIQFPIRQPSAAKPPRAPRSGASEQCAVWETVWESRSLPAVIQGRDESLGPSFFRESDLGPIQFPIRQPSAAKPPR